MNKSEMRAYVISKLVEGVKLIAATKVVPVKAEQVTSEGVLKTVLANGFVEAEGTKLNVGDCLLECILRRGLSAYPKEPRK